MLRLWRDLYRVVLHPNFVTVRRVQKARFSKSKEVEESCVVESYPLPVWKSAIDHLRGILSSMAAYPVDVEIVLSNHFSRYEVIPWSANLTANETKSMVRIRFEEVYGRLSDEWEIRFSEARYGEPGMACAVDRAMLHELYSIFGGTSLRLISVQPFLMAAFNSFDFKTMDDDFLLLLKEPGRVGMARICKRKWASIRLAQSEGAPDDLDDLMRREILVSGIEGTSNHYVVDLSDI